jgi:hypothetical protein
VKVLKPYASCSLCHWRIAKCRGHFIGVSRIA